MELVSPNAWVSLLHPAAVQGENPSCIQRPFGQFSREEWVASDGHVRMGYQPLVPGQRVYYNVCW